MSAAISQPSVLRAETEERLADLLSNPDAEGEDLYGHRAYEPDVDSMARDGAAP